MRFFSPPVLLAVLAASAYSAPTDKVSSLRYLDFSFRSNVASGGPVSFRNAEIPADEHLNKREMYNFKIRRTSNTGTVASNPGASGPIVDPRFHGLSGRDQNTNTPPGIFPPPRNAARDQVDSPPPGSGIVARYETPPPGTGQPINLPPRHLSSRSMDPSEGCHVMISVPNDLVQDLQKTGGQIPQYMSEIVQVTDPESGFLYQLVPDDDFASPSLDHITLEIVYESAA